MSRRTLVARLDSVGDVLLGGPAVRAVAAGSDEVWMLCSTRGGAAARLLPGVDHVLEWDCPWITVNPPRATPESLAALGELISQASPDAAVILTSFHQSPLPLALQLKLAGVPFIAAASVDFGGTLLDVRLRPGEDFPEDLPEPVRALTIAQAAGFVLPAEDDGRLRVVPGEPPAVAAGLGAPVVVHPGADAPARRWPAERFAEAVRLLHAEGHEVVVTGGPDEGELTRLVSGDGAYAHDLGGGTDLAGLAGLLERAAVLVAGNTGPAHLAAAVGTPVVSLFSPVVSASQWAPYGVPVILLGDQDEACRGTRATQCPVPGHPCLTSVEAAQVVEAVHALLPVSVREEVTV